MMDEDKNFIRDLKQGFLSGDRKSLAKAITLAESSLLTDNLLLSELLKSLPHAKKTSFRLGITGAPGVGKSTFISKLVPFFINAGQKVAILSIDPSSEISGGSIMADKLRMINLMDEEDVYIRPAPAKNILGGVCLSSYDIVVVLERFGFDVIIVETVGVGQNESLISAITDLSLMLLEPGMGDEWQAVKRGNLELIDLIAINKCEEDNKKDALKTSSYITNKKYFLISSTENIGIKDLYDELCLRWKSVNDLLKLKQKRQNALHSYFKYAVITKLIDYLNKDDGFNNKIEESLQSLDEQSNILAHCTRLAQNLSAKLTA